MSKELTPVQQLRGNLSVMTPEFKNALPSHIAPEKFVRVALTTIQNNPKLLEVSRQSLFSELLKCATDGLICDGAEAAIIPYGGVAKYQPMVKGICKKARNSGEISTIDAIVVYENDTYESWIDEKGPHFKHVKARKDRGEPVLTYAYAITKDGGFYHEEIDEEQMKTIENCSRGKDSPWKGGFRDEMKRKSAIKRLAKFRLPSSSDLENMLNSDNDLYDFNSQEPEKPVAEEKTPARLTALVSEPEKPKKVAPKKEKPKKVEQKVVEEPPIDITAENYDDYEGVPV
jgi:recombination protein RecT